MKQGPGQPLKPCCWSCCGQSLCHPEVMDPTPPEKEINRIEQELDSANSPGGKPPTKRGGSQVGKRGDGQAEKPTKHRSLDAVLVAAVLLFVISAVVVVTGRLSPTQRTQLTAGSIGGAIGLLIGYGAGTLKP